MVEESTRQLAGTPSHIFRVLHEDYYFTVDAAASDFNAKLPTYWTIKDNALNKNWRGKRAFCNPPWIEIEPWLEHALESDFTCFLLPARTDRPWWQKWKPYAETHYYLGRMQFVAPPGITYSSNPFPVVAMLFGDKVTPGKERWRYTSTGRLVVYK